MRRRPISMWFAAEQRDTVESVLAELGAEWERPQRVVHSVLESGDGRLQRRGLRLDVVEAGGVLQAVLTSTGSAEVRTASAAIVDRVPARASDLPAGPMRVRAEDALMLGVLREQIRVAAVRTTGRLVGHDGAVRMLVTITVLRSVDGRSDKRSLLTIESLDGADGFRRRTLAALVRLGLQPEQGDAIAAVADAAGIDLRGGSNPPTFELPSRPAAAHGYAIALRSLIVAIDEALPAALTDEDPEDLHELRVRIRRARSVIRDAKRVLPDALVDDGAAELRDLAALTGPTRDLDVLLERVWSLGRDLPESVRAGVPELLEVIERDRRRAASAMIAGLRATGWPATSARLVAALDGVLDPAHDRSSEPVAEHGDRPLRRVVRKRLARADDALRTDGRAIGADSPDESLHELRKDAKRLRYTLESFGQLLPAKARKRFVRHLKRLQDNLGEHQDAVVQAEHLRGIRGAHVAEIGAAGAAALDAVLAGLDADRDRTRSEFAERFAAFDTKAAREELDDLLDRLAT